MGSIFSERLVLQWACTRNFDLLAVLVLACVCVLVFHFWSCYWFFMSFPFQIEEFAFDHVLFSTKSLFHFLFIRIYLFSFVLRCSFFWSRSRHVLFFVLLVKLLLVCSPLRTTMEQTFMQLLPRTLILILLLQNWETESRTGEKKCEKLYMSKMEKKNDNNIECEKLLKRTI